MNLYRTIASEYSHLFPSSPEKFRAIETQLAAIGARDLLDIGCASGEFTRQIAAPGRTVTGLDLDEEMIREARLQSGTLRDLSFVRAEMTGFLQKSPPGSRDALLCLGNTLAYAGGCEELEQFLTQAARVLRPGGYLAVQILNYSNPAIRPGFVFPLLETPRISFSRRYVALETDPARPPSPETAPSVPARGYGFETRVTHKETGASLTDLHLHWPFPAPLLQETAARAGFSRSQVCGDYQGNPLTQQSFFALLHLWKNR